MELHHKLRRDPNWHPSACNICGQVLSDPPPSPPGPLLTLELGVSPRLFLLLPCCANDTCSKTSPVRVPTCSWGIRPPTARMAPSIGSRFMERRPSD